MRRGIVVVVVSLFALGALTTNAMVVAPSAFAASKTKSISSTLET